METKVYIKDQYDQLGKYYEMIMLSDEPLANIQPGTTLILPEVSASSNIADKKERGYIVRGKVIVFDEYNKYIPLGVEISHVVLLCDKLNSREIGFRKVEIS